MVRYRTNDSPAVPHQRPITASRADALAEMLRAVAHPLRLRIVALLCDGDLHVGALAERLEAPQAIVSQQLRVLRMGGLVEVRREEGRGLYRLREPRLRELVACMEGCSLAGSTSRRRGGGR
jgi:ArsR family transcriptional regulator